MTLEYRKDADGSDALPFWNETVTVDGEAQDLSDGWTFKVTLRKTGEDDVVKTAGILGQPDGQIQVQWDVDDLDIALGTWRAALVATRTADGRSWTARERLWIGPR